MAKTLKTKVRQQLWWIATGLLCACLILVAIFSWFNIQAAAAGLMRLEAQTIARQLQTNPLSALPHSKMLSVYRNWSEIPQQQRKYFNNKHFNDSKLTSSDILESFYRSEDGEQHYLFLMRHAMDNGKALFLLSQHSETEIEALTRYFFSTAITDALIVTAVIFLLLFLFISWLVKRAAQPITVLSRWASTLGTETEKEYQQSIAKFDIEELNQLALQLHCSINRIRRLNEREKIFLKHASHELRTPLAIIQTSLDTLNIQMQEKDKRQLHRALRASANMVNLTHALLWLARESKKPIPCEAVELVGLFKLLVNEHQYLLGKGELSTEFEDKKMIIEIEKNLLQIVLANLIRNAFQHSGSGNVQFKLKRQGLNICNSLPQNNHREVSFGLGIELVQRICDKMGWQFELNFLADSANVKLTWS